MNSTLSSVINRATRVIIKHDQIYLQYFYYLNWTTVFFSPLMSTYFGLLKTFLKEILFFKEIIRESGWYRFWFLLIPLMDDLLVIKNRKVDLSSSLLFYIYSNLQQLPETVARFFTVWLEGIHHSSLFGNGKKRRNTLLT